VSDFPPTIDELYETFDDLPEWDERYDFIIDLGRELPELPGNLQTAENVVEGCMSMVWLVMDMSEGGESIEIQADSDSLIVKGLIAVLLAFYANKSANEIIESDVSEYLKKLGLNQHLSPQRRNGLFSMIKRINALAEQQS
jgi:cysteine desulfuration protein SufE